MNGLTIGEVAKRSGIGVEALRFYERKGLIAAPPRRASGYRDYPPDVVERVNFIRRAKELGFSLSETAELLALRMERGKTRADVRTQANAKLAQIEQKLLHLRRLKSALQRLVASCTGRGPTGDCPILAALETSAEPPASPGNDRRELEPLGRRNHPSR